MDKVNPAGNPALLHLDASADAPHRSVSRQLTERFAEEWRAAHGPGTRYRYRDLVATPVAPITSAYAELGRRVERRGTVPADEIPALAANQAERHEWELTSPLIEEVRAARTVLIGCPMYNFAVPAALKAWIDRISFPGAFTHPDTGASRLARTRVVVLTARGGAYGPGTPRAGYDFQEPYLRAYFQNLGVPADRITFVHAELTLAAELPHLDRFRETAAGSLAAAHAAVTRLTAA